MKFIISSQSLLKQLQSIAGVLNNSNTLPILDNILFEIKDQVLTISCSDLESTITSKINIDAKSEGSIAIPAKILIDILKTFPDHPLTFSIDGNMSIEIASDYGKYKLSGFNGEEFPKSPIIESPSTVKISGFILQRAIEKTIFASGNDDLRPVMSGIFFQFSTESLTFVATDAHKLVRYTRHDLKSEETGEFIMPKKPLQILKNTLSVIDEEITIEYNQTNVQYRIGNSTLTCRLIDGKYPNYEAVIPKENPNQMTLNRNDFLNSVKRVSIFSNKTTYQVSLMIAGASLKISAEDLDYSNSAEERLDCDYQGDDIKIGFNSRFLIEMLSGLSCEDVKLSMSMPNRAGLLTPIDSTQDGEDITMLVMPVMLNN